MIRMGVIICFALTLLCPVFCLAATGDECSAHASLNGDNCEAMSIGAVVEKPARGISSPGQSILSSDGLLSPATSAVDPAGRWRLAARYWEQTKPSPTAARRQALLQAFLF
jgi:hypothetical protein